MRQIVFQIKIQESSAALFRLLEKWFTGDKAFIGAESHHVSGWKVNIETLKFEIPPYKPTPEEFKSRLTRFFAKKAEVSKMPSTNSSTKKLT